MTPHVCCILRQCSIFLLQIKHLSEGKINYNFENYPIVTSVNFDQKSVLKKIQIVKFHHFHLIVLMPWGNTCREMGGKRGSVRRFVHRAVLA
jgi:hypothetical protein